MEFPILVNGLSALLGVALGWLARGGFLKLALWCALGSVAFGAAVNLVVAGPPESLSANYLATAAFYSLYSWSCCLFLPSLVAATLVRFLQSGRKPE